MRKLLLIVMLLLTTVMSVGAIDEVELSALARYVPEDALVYAGIRTDDDYLQSLDALVSKALPFLPPSQVPSELSILDLLDSQLEAVGLGSFDESIRPWLGNTAAAAIFAPEDSNNDPDLLVLLEADGASAEAFFEPIFAEALQDGDMDLEEINGMTVYVSSDELNPVWIAFGDDTIFISNVEARIPAGEANPALSDKEDFGSLLSKLPADNYNIIVYINNVELQRFNIAQSGILIPPFLEEFYELSGGVALGFTMLNDEALVMDLAQQVDYSAFEEYGVSLVNPSPLDMSFTNRIPADAVAVMQSSDFGPSVQVGFDNLRALGEYIKANGGLADLIDPNGLEIDDEQARNALNQVDIAWFLGAINLSFAGGTGLSLENEALPALDGDVAAYLRVLPSPNFFIPVLPDGAILFQSSDAQATEAIVSQLGDSAQAYDTPAKSEAYGNGTALVFPAEETMGFDYPSLDLLIASSDDLVAIGTRDAVTASLDTSAGLADDATFQAALQYMLPDSQSMAYLATEPAFTAIDPLFEEGLIPLERDTEDAYRLISIVESATISVKVESDGTSLARFVITLNPEPRPLPAAPDA